MKPHEYVEMKAREKPYQLPEWFFKEDSDKVDWDGGYAYLEEAGYIVSTDDRFIYTDDLKEDYPEVYRLIFDIHTAEIQEELDHLVEIGYVKAFINGDGEMVYSLTDAGEEAKETLI